MGYFVNMNGNLETKGISEEKARNILERMLLDMGIDVVKDDDDDELDIYVYGYDKWWIENVENALVEIAPHTLEGEIEFLGEDGEFWKYEYDPNSKAWYEREGEKTYKKEKRIVKGDIKYV